ncbi:MAG: NAD(P)/FAD-dependent oxidoreductase [Actinobacteria bacterium]|nr:NAD(P)/FAD-dependent oxidoreductase [Actinomycetota bacterium]
MLEVDLLIVGAGPAGLYGAYYAGFRRMSTAVVDALPEPGGQVTALYPEKTIFDVAGFPAIRGRDLVGNLLDQAAPFHPRYILGEVASELTTRPDGSLVVRTDAGTTVHTQAVIITGGIGEFRPRPLPDGDAWLGRGLSYFVPRLAEHTDLDVLIVGGGDSAFDWALHLQPLARSVTVVHRRDRFRAHEHTVSQVSDLGVPILTFTEVADLRGADRLEQVLLRHSRTGEERLLPAQSVIAALGFTADLGPLAGWGLTVSKRHVPVDRRMATNLPRVYAAGDIADYAGKVRLISVGFGEVALAVNNAAVAINPDTHLFPGHSSDPH